MLIRTKREELIAARVKAGFSQRALARRAGIANGHLSQIERGLRNPSPKVARKIIVALGAEFNDLFELVPLQSDKQTA